eukprot:SAG22_NODE_3146_length_1904_cov_49.457064_2_plen_285_part_01
MTRDESTGAASTGTTNGAVPALQHCAAMPGLFSFCLPRQQPPGGESSGYGEVAGAELAAPLITLSCVPSSALPLGSPCKLGQQQQDGATPPGSPARGLRLERTSTADFIQSKTKLANLQALLDTTPTTRQNGLLLDGRQQPEDDDDGGGDGTAAEPTPRPTPLRARQPLSPLAADSNVAAADAKPRQRKFGTLDTMLASTPRTRLATASLNSAPAAEPTEGAGATGASGGGGGGGGEDVAARVLDAEAAAGTGQPFQSAVAAAVAGSDLDSDGRLGAEVAAREED